MKVYHLLLVVFSLFTTVNAASTAFKVVDQIHYENNAVYKQCVDTDAYGEGCDY